MTTARAIATTTKFASIRGGYPRLLGELKNSLRPRSFLGNGSDVWGTNVTPTEVTLCRHSGPVFPNQFFSERLSRLIEPHRINRLYSHLRRAFWNARS